MIDIQHCQFEDFEGFEDDTSGLSLHHKLLKSGSRRRLTGVPLEALKPGTSTASHMRATSSVPRRHGAEVHASS